MEFLNYALVGLVSGFVYSLIGLGFVLIYKCSGILNFAQGAIAVLSAYVLYSLATQLGMPIAPAILLTLAVGVLLGFIIQRYMLNRLIGQPVLGIIVLTLALSELLRGIMILGWGSGILNPPSLFPIGGFNIANVVNLSYSHIAFLIVSAIMIGGFALFYNRSKIGLAMKCTAEDVSTATSLGIRVPLILTVAWMIACLTAAVAGILVTNVMGISYNVSQIGLKGMAVVLVGGLESLPGVLIAGPLMGLIEFLAAGYLDPIVGGGMRDLAPYIVLLLVLLLRPSGIFGLARIERI